jgi:formamidopyrimidine-DNA glycosylase
MPELPEVETIRRHLAPRVEGRRLARLEIDDPRWCRPLVPAELAGALEGRRVERLARRGKYLVWEMSGAAFLIVHLRMTGTLLDRAGSAAPLPHTRVRFTLDGGADGRLVFVDPRRFGTGELARSEAERVAFFAARLGVEPLGEAFTGAYLHALARRSRAPVKAFLLDQKRVAGVGNIYADEALFRARIHPLRPANRLTAAQCAALRDAVVEALSAGIAAKGASIDDFRHPDGVRGAFQDEFLVHRREGGPCPVCTRPVRKLRAAGRGTYACERCQPRPRRRRQAASGSSRPSRSAATSSW